MIPCYCLPDSASKGSLAGPIGPVRYLLLARKGQQKLEDLENMEKSATCVPCFMGKNHFHNFKYAKIANYGKIKPTLHRRGSYEGML